MPSNLIAMASLRLTGWKFESAIPAIPKYVVLSVPHTSNWDGLLLVLLARSIGLPMEWMIKDNWLKGPQASLVRWSGAIGIDRSTNTNMVAQMVELFRKRDRLALFIPPEGTRTRTERWKSGFYHIARGANVPVIPGYLDYSRKRGGLGPPITMTGDVRADMDAIRAFYTRQAPIGLHPEKFGPIRLREEDEESKP